MPLEFLGNQLADLGKGLLPGGVFHILEGTAETKGSDLELYRPFGSSSDVCIHIREINDIRTDHRKYPHPWFYTLERTIGLKQSIYKIYL